MDAEYTVLDAQFNTMRLPIDGVYADRMALANVWIGHKGKPVCAQMREGKLIHLERQG
jgi:DNA ligase-1